MGDALARLTDGGVSIWLDDLSRALIESGELAELVGSSNVVGVTTNPTIFAAALTAGDRYSDQIRALASVGTDLDTAVAEITTEDVRRACDILQPVFRASGGLDGWVSIEVDPRLARDADATLDAARQLWSAVDRANVMIKIPATVEGLPAVTSALAEGINVNVTLIFGVERYRAVANAFISGLERARSAGHDLSGIASVASFFVSRIDTEVDRRLVAIGTPEALTLRGKAAVASARLAYQAFEEICATSRWFILAADGAFPQRPLWASTGVKNPAYPDTLYVTELVARGTVNTMPAATLKAVADHGQIADDPIRDHYDEAAAVLDALESLGVPITDVAKVLEEEGLEKFEASWATVRSTVSGELARAAGAPLH